MKTLRKRHRFFGLLLVASLVLTGMPNGFDTRVEAISVQAPQSAETLQATPMADVTLADQKYHEKYVTKGLIGLFTAFTEDGLYLKSGVWVNKKRGYGDATLLGDGWELRDGGVGYSMTLDEWRADGTKMGIALPESFASLPTFYAEVYATVEGITDQNGDRYVNKYTPEVTDESGKVIAPATGARYGYFKNYCSAFRFDLISTLFFCSLDDSRASASLAQRWYLYSGGYPGSYPPEASSEYFRGDPSYYENAWRTSGVNGEPVPAQMRVTKKTWDGSVTYAYSYSDRKGDSITITEARREALLAHKATDAASVFSLFNALPATVYAIRVYNRVLNEEEMLQNAFIDKAVYYRLDLEAYDALTADEKKTVHTAFEKIGFSEDRDYVLALYDSSVGKDPSAVLKSVMSFVECRPVMCEGGGYRLLFSVNERTLDFLTAAGLQISFGGLAASAEKVTKNGDLTLENANALKIPVGGDGGSRIYYETVTQGKKCFSIAITASDPQNYTKEMRVRGYLSVTAPDGTVTTVYTDVSSQALRDGVGSIASVTEYFVNRYDGDLKTACEYNASAVLRYVLSASGITVRELSTQRRSLYVNPVTGNDRNDGKTESTAYATVEAAFLAAKAYLKMSGKRLVDIYLSEGTHTVNEALSLSGDEIYASDYAVRIIGSGEKTILTSEKRIDHTAVGTDPETGAKYFRIQKTVDGSYPEIRALYGDGKLLSLAHSGDSEHVVSILSYRVVNGVGRALTTEENTDWKVVDAEKENAKYGVFTLPATLFEGDVEDYVGAELHFGAVWNACIVHIDHVVKLGGGIADVYVTYGEAPVIHNTHKITGRGAWLENARVLLHENADTYYYDSDSGIVYYREGERSLESFDYIAYATEENLFEFKDISGVTISDVTVTGLDSRYLRPQTTAQLGQASSLTLRYSSGATTSVGFMTAAAVYGENVKKSRFERIHMTETLGAGICIKGMVEGVVIDSCSFINLGDAAIRLGSGAYSAKTQVKNVEVTNNYVRRIGTLYMTSVAIQLNTAADCRLIGNTVIDVPYSAFSVGWLWSTVTSTSAEVVEGSTYCTYNTEIAYNYVTDFMTCMGDGGAFYLLGGNVTRDAGDKNYYNYMHHNYVNVSPASGEHAGSNMTGRRHIMCYYHDNSSSNWHDYENVLINTTGTEDTFYAAYHQNVKGCEAQNNRQENNYFIGVSSLLAIYASNKNLLATNKKFGVSASDYAFASVAALAREESLSPASFEDAVIKTAPRDSKTTVAEIFEACGSTLYRETRVSGLTWTASAPERVLLSEEGTVNIEALIYAPEGGDGDDVGGGDDNGNGDIGDENGDATEDEGNDTGDVNDDGIVDEKDVAALEDHIVKKALLSEDALLRADVNGDGKADARDVMRIKQYLARVKKST